MRCMHKKGIRPTDYILTLLQLLCLRLDQDHSPNAVLMLDQRLPRWPNIEPTLEKCTMFERVLLPSKHKTFVKNNIYTTSAKRLRPWSNIV